MPKNNPINPQIQRIQIQTESHRQSRIDNIIRKNEKNNPNPPTFYQQNLCSNQHNSRTAICPKTIGRIYFDQRNKNQYSDL
jgi:hypothetical protein